MKKIGENGPYYPKSYYEQQKKEMNELFESFKKLTNISSKRNWSYTIKEGEHAGKTLWSGRYCAVTGIVYYKVHFPHFDNCDIYVLAEKRGKGTPDYQGLWCLPCGFLEANEFGDEGISRETLEETGIEVPYYLFKLVGVQTDPEKSNNTNVTLRYAAEVETMETPNYININGEKDEVTDVKWINISNVNDYKWAFGHDELIKNYFSSLNINIKNFDKRTDLNKFKREML